MRLLRERLSDFRESNLQTVQEWTKSDIELIALYVHPKNSNLRSHLRAIMALDHSRLDLENKSGRTFCVRQVYFTKSCQQIWGACKPTLYTFYTLHLRWNSTMKRAFLVVFFSIQNSERMQYFTINCAIQIVLIQYSGPSQYAWDFSETVKKRISKITYTASRFSLLTSAKFAVRAVSVWMNTNRVTLQHIYLLLAEFSVHTVNYGPSFSVDLWPARFARGP